MLDREAWTQIDGADIYRRVEIRFNRLREAADMERSESCRERDAQ
jgi:hypothetical protein